MPNSDLTVLIESDNDNLVELPIDENNNNINDDDDDDISETEIPIDTELEFQQPINEENVLAEHKFYAPSIPLTKSSSSSSKTSSPATLHRNLSAHYSAKLKNNFKIDLDKVYTNKKCTKFVSFESADRQDYYDFLFSADVATPSLEVPEIFNIFGSSSSLEKQSNFIAHRLESVKSGSGSGSSSSNNDSVKGNSLLPSRGSSLASRKNDLNEQIPLQPFYSIRNKSSSSKKCSSSGEDT